MIDMTLNTCVQDQAVYQVPLEIVSDILSQVKQFPCLKHVLKFINLPSDLLLALYLPVRYIHAKHVILLKMIST